LKRLRARFVIHFVHPEEQDALPEPLPGRSKAGRLLPTRKAPARPEVEDDDLTLEGRERDGGTPVTHDRELEVWSGLVDGDCHRRPLRRAENVTGTATPCGRPPDREGDEEATPHQQRCRQSPAAHVGPWVADLDRVVISGERRSHEGNLLRGAVVFCPHSVAPGKEQTRSRISLGPRGGSWGRSFRFIPVPTLRSPEVAEGSGLWSSARPTDAPGWGSRSTGRPSHWRRGKRPSADYPAGTVFANVVGEVGE